MRAVKEAELGLTSKPYPVADLIIHEPFDEPLGKTSWFKNMIPKVHVITIGKNKDFDELPF